MKQTLLEFIDSPFFLSNNLKSGVNELEKKFLAYDKVNKIKLFHISINDNSYYYHFKVPSETHAELYYDVVLEFYNDDIKLTLPRYNMRLFSNSPSFIYKYASLYALNEMLIPDLYDKIGKENLAKLPEKSNSSMELNYDKTLYYACRYLKKHRILMLNKSYFRVFPQTPFNKFITEISTTSDKNTEIEISRSTRQVEKSLDKVEKLEKEKISTNRGSHGVPKSAKSTPREKVAPREKISPNMKTQKKTKKPKK